MAKKKSKAKKFNAALAVVLAIVCLFVGLVGGYFGYLFVTAPTETDVYTAGSLSVHFLELGNKYTGDCTYIKAGDTDILIDGGSRVDSVSTISEYLDEYVTDGKLEYVIVTHAHQDHYASFATNIGVDSIFDLYECETIIDFALTNQKQNEDKDGDGFGENMYSDYLRERNDEINAGAKHYTAAQCIEQNMAEFKLSETATLKILDQKFYYEKAETENDYSVCMLLSEGDNHYLFTGDLESAGEASLVVENELPKCRLFKAGHHGSKTSSTTALLQKIQPDIVCVCCCCGSDEYTQNNENQFPTQAFINRISPYTSQVYVTTIVADTEEGFTSMNGNIVVMSKGGELEVRCSNNATLLKDTEWFKANRMTPSSWQN